jgi:hypothetical protein
MVIRSFVFTQDILLALFVAPLIEPSSFFSLLKKATHRCDDSNKQTKTL